MNAEIAINQVFLRFVEEKEKLTDTGLYGFSRIRKILLDGKCWTLDGWGKYVINQLSISNIHLTDP